MKRRIELLAEHIGESSCACLVMMVQGNFLLLSLSHWLVAMQTGVAAGTIATLLVLIGRATRPWIISLVLGAVTAVVDFVIHPGAGPAVFAEALLTGLGAGLLSLLVAHGVALLRRHRPRLWRRRSMISTHGREA